MTFILYFGNVYTKLQDIQVDVYYNLHIQSFNTKSNIGGMKPDDQEPQG